MRTDPKWFQHARLIQVLREDGGVVDELPRPVDVALDATLEKLTDHVDGRLAWRAICHLLRTRCLRPQLFGHLSDTQLDELEETIDYYGLPKPLCVLVQQERAARHVSADTLSQMAHRTVPDAATAPLVPLITVALRKATALMKNTPFPVSKPDCWRIICNPTLDPAADGFLLSVVVGHRPTAFGLVAFNVSRLLAACGDLEGLKYIHEQRCPWDEGTCSNAALNGYLDCLQYAHKNGCAWTETTCSNAAFKGSLDCLAYAHKQGCAWDKGTCSTAAFRGSLDCLMYAHMHGCAWDKSTCANAAYSGALDCLKYAHERGCAWNWMTCSFAARSKRDGLRCLKYAHEHGCDWNEDTCANAAQAGNLDCLIYAREHGCDWGEDTCSDAARAGHLDCLKYAREHGCDWDEYTCSAAARTGHLDCLTYAHEHGCAWDEQTYQLAVEHGHTDCATYALEHGCPMIGQVLRRRRLL